MTVLYIITTVLLMVIVTCLTALFIRKGRSLSAEEQLREDNEQIDSMARWAGHL